MTVGACRQRKRLAAAMQGQVVLLVTGPFSGFGLLKALDFLEPEDMAVLAQELIPNAAELATQKVCRDPGPRAGLGVVACPSHPLV